MPEGGVAIIVAAGRSRRMGFDKLAAPLAGPSVLERSVRRMMEVPEIDRVIAVCDPSRFDSLLGGPFPKPLLRVDGGAERQDSVLAGLQAIDQDPLVAVHDGARPLVSAADVSRAFAVAESHAAAALARPATETLKRTDASGKVVASIDRDHLWFMETPQVFRTSLLKTAYAKVQAENTHVTDEVSAVESLGHPVLLVASTRPNPKITVPADLDLALALLR
jgi:2-C-methyl-D-erythritol 4-phosphate cytidylyltransferase